MPHHQKNLQSLKLLEQWFFPVFKFCASSFTGLLMSIFMVLFASSGFNQWLKSWTNHFHKIVKLLRYFLHWWIDETFPFSTCSWGTCLWSHRQWSLNGFLRGHTILAIWKKPMSASKVIFSCKYCSSSSPISPIVLSCALILAKTKARSLKKGKTFHKSQLLSYGSILH